ncbi:alpha/beta-hydrolase [Neocallimastix lanati (nom. inval.)]|nr:alpha/beta-hydrolase [Neocallimastix sp. JGI-2020a]
MNIKYVSLFISLLASLVKSDLPPVPNAEKYIVKSIPDIDTSNISQYAGMDGVFMENGPYTFDRNDHIIRNPYSWNKHSNIVYVDQPTGTGFSYTKNNDIPRNEFSVGRDFNTFLSQFFKVFPQYENAEIYIAGESFAGTYIPYIASNLINNPVNGKKINLQGIAIGNGWMDPLRQYQGYLKYSVDNNILSGNALTKASQLISKCTEEYKKGDRIKNYSCEYILDTILDGSTANGQYCINMYDIRLRDYDRRGGCGLYSWPLTLGGMTKYLRRSDVIDALHVSSTPHSWTECTSRVSSALSGDSSPPSYNLFPELLKHIKITLFAGDKDLICNHVGIELMIDNLTWNGIKGYKNNYIDWVVNGKIHGVYQSERNLTYIRMTNGSHMVPIDLPKESLAMFNTFIGVNEEEKASLNNLLDYNKGQKKLSSAVAESKSTIPKILSIPFFGFGLIAGISFFAIHKRRQNNTEYNIEWHELIENENDNSMEDSNDNVIDIELEDETLSETYNENEILDV